MIEGVSASVNDVRLLQQLWYNVVQKKKVDAAQIFDLGDGPSGRSVPHKFSFTVLINGLVSSIL